MIDKVVLRQRAKRIRWHFFSSHSSQELLEFEEKRINSLWKLRVFQDFLREKEARVIGLYNAIRDEASTSLLIERLSKIGCSLALPRLTQEGEMCFHRWLLKDRLIESSLGLVEPPKEAPLVVPDLCLVPLLAFHNKKRLGYGKGHYDRYFVKHSHIIKIGWAYECQKVDNLIVDEHDVPLDKIVYEN